MSGCERTKYKPTGSDYLDKDGVDSDEDTDDDKCFDRTWNQPV